MQKLIFCTQKVNRDMIRRESRKGVEHIVLTSFTLPPNIVMNGGLYLESEVNSSFDTLNRTPVTIDHPEVNGQFVSANDPEADFDFRIGAFNENARKMPDGRIRLDKVINVQKAMMTEKGKRLLDRIGDIETNDSAKPIHTSVGVFVESEDLEEPISEFNGLTLNAEASWIARNMLFDHDAILLDSDGAATPDQGTGIGINSSQIKVEHVTLEPNVQTSPCVNELSFSEIGDRIQKALDDRFKGSNNPPHLWVLHDAIKSSTFVYDQDGTLFQSSYSVDENDNVRIQDDRIEVVRSVVYTPVNETREDNLMRDAIIAELGNLGISVNADISDVDLQAKLKETLASRGNDDGALQANQELAGTVETQAGQIAGLQANIDARDAAELDKSVAKIMANEVYKELGETAIKAIHASDSETFAKMLANSFESADIGSTHLAPNAAGKVDSAMFEVNTGDAS